LTPVRGMTPLGRSTGPWWRLRSKLFPNGRLAITPLANQLLTGYPIVVGVQVVGVRAILRKFPLCFSLVGEVGAV